MSPAGLGGRRILMTADAVGGVWTYALTLGGGLVRGGARVALAVLGDPPDAAQRAAARRNGLELHEIPGRLEWMPAPWPDVQRAGEALQTIAQRFRPDVVHLNGYAHAALSWPAPTLVVGHSCVWSWSHAVRGAAPGAEWTEYRIAVRRGLRAASGVTAPTAAMLASLREHYGPFRDAGAIHNAARPPALLGRTNADRRRVVTAGRLWDEAKNVQALARAALRCPWPVYAIGPRRLEDRPPADEARMGAMDAALRAADRGFAPLRYIGPRSSHATAEWLLHAGIYAAPALYEPFGLAILEAAHAGCALVLGDIASLREVWQDAAAYVPPRDADALAAQLAALAADEPLRRRLAAAARQRAARYTVERMVARYTRLYRTLARGGGAAAQTVAAGPAGRTGPA